MCLVPKESAKIADKDIIVYKVLLKYSNGTYHSPYRDATYEIGKLYTANIRYRTRLTHKVDEYPITVTVIEEGLHTCIDYSAATLIAAMVSPSGLSVFKGVIPKGALYVLGTGNEIVSTQLKLIEQCH